METLENIIYKLNICNFEKRNFVNISFSRGENWATVYYERHVEQESWFLSPQRSHNKGERHALNGYF